VTVLQLFGGLNFPVAIRGRYAALKGWVRHDSAKWREPDVTLARLRASCHEEEQTTMSRIETATADSRELRDEELQAVTGGDSKPKGGSAG
jgi:hypothetical protein